MTRRRPLVYVAGPITGNPFGCVRQATDAFDHLRLYELVPFLPQLSVLHEMVAPRTYEDWLAYDMAMLEHCHGLVRLGGDSPGADREVAAAHDAGMPVLITAGTIGQTPSRLVDSWISEVIQRCAADHHPPGW